MEFSEKVFSPTVFTTGQSPVSHVARFNGRSNQGLILAWKTPKKMLMIRFKGTKDTV
jgi:hypothetical protein